MCTPLGSNIEYLQALITSRSGCDHRDAWATKNNLILQITGAITASQLKAELRFRGLIKFRKLDRNRLT
jgi:hypothetical protein